MAEPTTDAEVAELRRLNEAATPGPWLFDPENVGMTFDSGYGLIAGYTPGSLLAGYEVVHVRCSVRFAEKHGDGVAEANAALVSAARNALPGLLARLEQAERERDEAYSRGKRDGMTEENHRASARIATLERERDEARATSARLNRRVGDMESEAARIAKIEARIAERNTRKPLPRIEAAFALAAAEERIATLEAAGRGMLASADAEWETSGAGHDWREACSAMRAALRGVEEKSPEAIAKEAEK